MKLFKGIAKLFGGARKITGESALPFSMIVSRTVDVVKNPSAVKIVGYLMYVVTGVLAYYLIKAGLSSDEVVEIIKALK